MQIIFRNVVAPSSIVNINALVLEKKAAGERVYNASIGEPVLPPHPIIVAAATEALAAGKTLYAPAAGIPELRAAASDWLNRTYHTDYTPANILATAGGKFGLYALCRTLLAPGDETILVAPYWVTYPGLITMTGATVNPIVTQEQHGWKLTPEVLRTHITQKTRMIFFNNGANPTGVVYSAAEIRALIAVAQEHEVVFVSDEVYSGLTYEGEFVSAGSFSEFKDCVVVIQSCSKHFAMTGWRVGFVCGDARLIQALANLQGQCTIGAASIAQWAAVAALNHAEQIISETRAVLQRRRDALMRALMQAFNKNFVVPAAALYFFVSLADLGVTETDSLAWCERVLREANVALVPGSAFGLEGYVRFAFGNSEEELVGAVEALATYLEK